MKSVKITSLITAFSFTLAVILLISACNESDKDTNTNPLVGQPKIDIQSVILADRIDIVKQHIEAETDITKRSK